MSDSGLPPPPSSSTPSPVPPPSGDAQTARVEETSGDLRDVRRALRIRGEVVKHNRDGTITVRTDRGTVDVRLRGKDLPAEGEQVELDIPPGRPPRQIIVRPAPDIPQPQQPAPPAQNPPASPQPPSYQPRPLHPLVPLLLTPDLPPDLRQQAQSLAEDVLLAARIRVDDIVRLALPPQTNLQLLPSDIIFPLSEHASIPQAVPFHAVIAASPLSGSKPAEIITVPSSPLQAAFYSYSFPSFEAFYSPENLAAGARTIPHPADPVLNLTIRLVLMPGSMPVFSGTQLLTPPFPQTIPDVQKAFLWIDPDPAAAPASQKKNADAQNPPVQVLPANPKPFLFSTAGFLPAPLLSGLKTDNFSAGHIVLQSQSTFTSLIPSLQLTPENPPIMPVMDARIVNILPAPVMLSQPAPVFGMPDTVPAVENASGETVRAHQFQTILLPNETSLPNPAKKLLFNSSAENQQNMLITGQPALLRAEVTGLLQDMKPVVTMISSPSPEPFTFVLHANGKNLLPGMIIEFLPLDPQQIAPLPLNAPAAPLPFADVPAGLGWPALDEMKTVLAQQGALPLYQSLVQHAMPNPSHPARLPAAAMFFIAAIRAGDIGSWIGEKTADTLRRAGRSDILGRLTRDVAGLQRLESEPVGQDWRALSLPLYWQDDVHKMTLFYRRDRSGKGDGDEKPNGTRFILDLKPNRMGQVQLDGLHRDKKLDLIVRTHQPLSVSMQQAMRRSWTTALEQTQLSGELSFQNKPEQFIKITPEKGAVGFSA